MDEIRLKRLHGAYQSQQIQKAYKGIQKICASFGLQVPAVRSTNDLLLAPEEHTVTLIPPRASHKPRTKR